MCGERVLRQLPAKVKRRQGAVAQRGQQAGWPVRWVEAVRVQQAAGAGAGGFQQALVTRQTAGAQAADGLRAALLLAQHLARTPAC